jgi:hypothetical protein
MAEYFSLADTFRHASPPPSFEQQTFLGASIVNFTLNCGMGDSSSSLNVELVVDEFNSGDATGFGFGHDIYHGGVRDRFAPPPIGSPVFFSFGHKRATTRNAYLKTFDDLCGTAFSSPSVTGHYHLTFGGILQSYTKNNSSTMGEKYSLNIVDPREILANAQMILNNYGGSNYGNTNLVNIYGFLEHNVVDPSVLPPVKLPLTQALRTNGSVYYEGSDMRYQPNSIPSVAQSFNYLRSLLNTYGRLRFPIDYDQVIYDPRLFESALNIGSYLTSTPSSQLTRFPITGTGFARINSGGIPIYRVVQAINAMCGFYGQVPTEYLQAGYSTYIYFRGLKYIVDLSSLPIVDPTQRLDYDQMSILDFCMEICDIANHDLIVTLLPIIDICGSFYQFNLNGATVSDPPFGGIIKISTVDRSNPPKFGVLKSFIDSIKNPESTDVGFELSNITSDKFLIGAQKVDQHFFTTAQDKLLPAADEYKLEKQFDLQVIPYYGLINNQAVTIPKGTGPYKQILLDSSTLNANGVGDFYVATEMELRVASVSYEQWSQFLLMYNDKYLESVEADDIRDNITIAQSNDAGGGKFIAEEENYAVTVPRCVWGPPQPDVQFSGGLPVVTNFCNPPYGYPLYYKRATQIGIPEAGLAGTINKGARIISDIEKLLSMTPDKQGAVINNIYDSLVQSRDYGQDFSPMEQELFDILQTYKTALANNQPLPNSHALLMSSLLKNAISMVAKSKKQAKDSLRNAKRVYDYLKNIADECLGKKYLVKIPQKVNKSFSYYINNINPTNITQRGAIFSLNSISEPLFTHNNNAITSGPYGFMPKSINGNIFRTTPNPNFVKDMLQPPTDESIPISSPRWAGALKINKNPFNNEFEFNYYPEPNGGFFDFNLEENVGGGPLAVRQGLVPIDASNFITDNGRLCAYVRYDNSHFLSFDKMPQDSFTQQRKENNFYSPDVSYNLPNTRNMSEIPSQEDISANNNSSAVAFVKCTIDDKFYMPPSGMFYIKNIYNGVMSKILRGIPKKVKDPQNSSKTVDGITPMRWHFEPTEVSDGGNFSVYDFTFRKNLKADNPNDPNRNLQLFSNQGSLYKPYLELDTRHVYALITLPDKVVPTTTTLMGQKSDANVLTYMHLLFADTIKSDQDPGGFGSLVGHGRVFPPNFSSRRYRDEYSLDTWEANASEAEKKAISGLTFASQKIEFAAPSPVIPSLVALPLLSKSDCYGPWRSVMFHDLNNNNSFNTTDLLLGGKVEFIKDENLAPWNFNGYKLLNEYGKSLARFLSTPMIYAERGGFTVADAPSGLSLGSIIRWQGLNTTNNTMETFYGPLITNISTTVSSDSIRTTYQCNSYTASFGRLEKKKQELISKISRNQQKLKDEKNALIRKNIGKNQNTINYNKLYKDMQQISRSSSKYEYSNIESNKPVNNNNLEVYSTQPQKQDVTIFREDGTSENVSGVFVGDVSSISTSHENYAEMASIMMQNPITFFRSHYFSAVQDKAENLAAISLEPRHPTMPSMEHGSMINMEYGDNIDGVTYWS